ncbi:hypothetical protein DUNSADRAFT_8564 [Dunaliella salina]|uniref:Uncharacterized protein n=1 Tax=Dunaliella salina TaxID=3046 RepID=A0ABQ7GJ97_DUNSA|nr:hypothetical protein DUNSADRAFT_8564 [Dunaliella salina]|eukprot:KAF5834682.1 hypothetical protein DUNSADRAFT_8564 [Dunaliella salina]
MLPLNTWIVVIRLSGTCVNSTSWIVIIQHMHQLNITILSSFSVCASTRLLFEHAATYGSVVRGLRPALASRVSCAAACITSRVIPVAGTTRAFITLQPAPAPTLPCAAALQHASLQCPVASQHVYTSCIVPQARLALLILAHLARIRNDIAAMQGYESHAHATLEGSILGTPEAATAFTASLSSALSDYAASDLGNLSRMARRAGLDVHEPPKKTEAGYQEGGMKAGSGHAHVRARVRSPPPGYMPLDPWNIDYLIARAAELQAAPRTPRCAAMI